MEGLLKAIEGLENALSKAPNEAVRAHVQSAVTVMRNAVEDNRSSAPASDTLARMTSVPEAVVSCRPPSTALKKAQNGHGAASDNGGMLPPPLSGALATAVKTWGFDIHQVAAAELPALCFGAMMQHPELERVLPPVALTRLWKYVQVVASRYRDNPFHSYRHAVDVTLGTSCLLRWTQEAHPGLLSDLQVVAVLLAAMVHDTDHPGVMNNFLVATRHPLAVLYNHQSVLENHHIASAMALTARPELDWLSPLPAAEQVRSVRRAPAPAAAAAAAHLLPLAPAAVLRPAVPAPTVRLAQPTCVRAALSAQAELRKAMIELVLATDVTTHIPFMKRFAEDVAAKQMSATQAMTVILKASDISNPTRPLPIYAAWVEGIMREFFAQGDAEKALGLPVSMNCDRESVNVNKCQVGFISFIVAPIWKGVAEFLPEVKQQLLPVLQANLEHYQGLAS